jgi:SWI/SNF-related matrix-associated actin-dependent regulator 1 of chromatin subfamily A
LPDKKRKITKRVATLLDGQHYLISFSSTEPRIWESLKQKVKQIPSAFWIPTSKKWRIDVTPENTDALKKYGFQFIGEAFFASKGLTTGTQLQARKPPKAKLDRELFDRTLRNYQIEAIQMLHGLGGLGILGDPAGSGKSAVISSYCKLIKERPILIICPAGLKIHWQRELSRWAGLTSFICSGSLAVITNYDYDVYICNYDILGYWHTELDDIDPQVVIVDECQYLLNPDSIRSKSVVALAKKANKFIAISATPMMSRAREFFTVLNLIDPQTFGSHSVFKNRYCDPKDGYFGVTYDGTSNAEELHALISGFLIRRNKAEILPELPPINRIILPIAIDDPTEYTYIEQELNSAATSKEEQEIMKRLYNKLFLLKGGAIIEWIQNWLDANEGEQLVVAAYHLYVLDALEKEFAKISLRIDGSVPSEKRQDIVDKFESGKKRVMLIQLISGGVGITLTSASTLVFTELWYVPGSLHQTEERIHRISQKADHVDIYYLIGAGTIEEDRIMKMLDDKQEDVSKVLDGKKRKYFE